MMDDDDRATLRPTNAELQALFLDATRACGEATVDVMDTGQHLFARAYYERSSEVRPGDKVRAGVAMRTLGDDVLVHPLVLREICINGAVRAHAVSTRCIARQRIDATTQSVHSYSIDMLRDELAATVQGCAAPASFEEGVEEMRAALHADAEQVLEVLNFARIVGSLGSSPAAQFVYRSISRLQRQLAQAGGRDRTAFAFGNALTAAGRDAPLPAARWALEEYGAAVFGASRAPSAPPVATLRGQALADPRGR